MDDHAGHDHSRAIAHDHAAHSSIKRLRIALALSGAFLVVEIIGGFLSNSLALIADAGHMLTDVAALALSLFVAWFTRQPTTPQKSYGYLRWEILAAFLNGSALLLISAAIIIESIVRIRTPEPVGGLMLWVAIGGLITNDSPSGGAPR